MGKKEITREKMKYGLALFAAVAKAEEYKPDRFDIVQSHAMRLLDWVETQESNPSRNKRYGNRLIGHVFGLILSGSPSFTDESFCNPEGYVAEEEDVSVFSEDDYCRLNQQVNRAINSLARKFSAKDEATSPDESSDLPRRSR